MIFFWPFGWYGNYALLSLAWDAVGVVFLVLFLYFFFKNFHRTRTWWTSRETPCEILKRRYAAGEITREEYERIKEDLGCK